GSKPSPARPKWPDTWGRSNVPARPDRTVRGQWLAGAEARAARQREDQVLAEEIRKVHGASGGAHGSPRVTAELRENGHHVNEKRVARVMRTYSIAGIRLRRRVRTTVPDPASSPVPDLLQRNFTAPEPGRKLMGDITYR
ncbi:IS3 family transposase, partial [Streptomyces phaeochromogenes]|uniref:IS3 family transposase n=1 Tax=Streptomyces phaeochromogenes TaxID=1923 RepID=UPI003F4D0089